MDIGNPAQIAQARARLRNLLDDMDSISREGGDGDRRSKIFTDGEGSNLALVARRLLKESDLRGAFFGPASFSDPAWHILLDLFVAAAERKRVSVSSLCVAARVPSSTALRWIKHLTDAGLIGRTADHEDRRRFFIHIEPQAFADMAAYLARISGGTSPVTQEMAAPRQG
ncbi:MarR family transcriptional regulator [Sphingobium phenoxybenzoativorans]|nr:MarR family transcriptional regulator [Sphingobium phenoxybenzoativorans]